MWCFRSFQCIDYVEIVILLKYPFPPFLNPFNSLRLLICVLNLIEKTTSSLDCSNGTVYCNLHSYHQRAPQGYYGLCVLWLQTHACPLRVTLLHLCAFLWCLNGAKCASFSLFLPLSADQVPEFRLYINRKL